jgi:two-component system phosphate regulon response regulator PhoB
MNLAKDLVYQIADQSLSRNKRAQLRCRLAWELEEEGNYEGAREAMGELWQRVGERPVLEGLDQQTKAEVLMRVGALTGWIGSTRQIEGAQELAKNLLSESVSLFDTLLQTERVAEARSDLAYCYWREGAFDEARVMLMEAVSRLDDQQGDVKALALLRHAAVEKVTNRLSDALRILSESAYLFEMSNNHTLKGRFHNEFGTVLKNLGAAECRQDYVDRALIEYAAASFHFEQAGHARYQACVENNLAMLFLRANQFPEAHEHLDRAQALFTSLKDKVHLAQVDETRARVMLAEGRMVDAEKLVSAAVRTLENGGEQSLLAEALSTYGIALAGLSDFDQAQATLKRAVDVAVQAGDPEGAGQAALVMVEQLAAYLSNDELKATVDEARELLKNTQDRSTSKRLANCTWRVLSLVHASPRFPSSVDWPNFSVKDEVLRYEAHFIRLALKETSGMVTPAAGLLGLTSHQTLVSMLNRHEDLLKERTPVKPRVRSIIRRRDATSKSRKKTSRKVRPIKILHVDDDPMVAKMVKDCLAFEGMQVKMCPDGTAALKKIVRSTHYDLLLLDYELRGLSGAQLIKRTRGLAHRRRIPIVILSATLDSAAARASGADAFLRKPEDISAVGETVARLVGSAKERS